MRQRHQRIEVGKHRSQEQVGTSTAEHKQDADHVVILGLGTRGHGLCEEGYGQIFRKHPVHQDPCHKEEQDASSNHGRLELAEVGASEVVVRRAHAIDIFRKAGRGGTPQIDDIDGSLEDDQDEEKRQHDENRGPPIKHHIFQKRNE